MPLTTRRMELVSNSKQSHVGTAVFGWAWPVGVGTVGVVEEKTPVGTQVPLVARDVAEGTDRSQDLGPGAGIEVELQGGEYGEQGVDVVDADAHLRMGEG